MKENLKLSKLRDYEIKRGDSALYFFMFVFLDITNFIRTPYEVLGCLNIVLCHRSESYLSRLGSSWLPALRVALRVAPRILVFVLFMG